MVFLICLTSSIPVRWNDKAMRKEEWLKMGLPSTYLVPTLYHTPITTNRVSLDFIDQPELRAQVEKASQNHETT